MFSLHMGEAGRLDRRLSFDAADSSSKPDDGRSGGGDDDGDATLEDAARQEQEYVRCRLRDELGREPGEEELNEWLREHTEGY